MSVLRIPQIETYAGEFERRRPAFQRGDWGSEPPDPGSAPTKTTRITQVSIVCLFATHQYLSPMLIQNLRYFSHNVVNYPLKISHL
jgi:hypothetical protein